MKFTSKKSALGVIAVTATLLLSFIVPTAQANTYSLPEAPTNVSSMMGRDGVVVKWTPSAGANPQVTGYVVSAGAGSCPIYVHGKNRSIITMPVVVGQPAGTPVVQAVNSYGFSKPAVSKGTHSAADLAKVASTNNQAVQILQLSDFHGAVEVGTSFGAPLLASNWDADRAANKATIAISSGDNFGAAPPI
jgi:5'-nucleotidase